MTNRNCLHIAFAVGLIDLLAGSYWWEDAAGLLLTLGSLALLVWNEKR